MDPTTCMEILLKAISNRDNEKIRYAAYDLAEWISRGGEAPDMKLAMKNWETWVNSMRNILEKKDKS